MSEIEDLMGVWGAIDHAVVDNPELAEVVGRYVGAYRTVDEDGNEREGAAGWFDEFTAWTGESFPPLDEALRNLAEIDPRGRRRARRILAIAVAARVFPDLQDSGSSLHEDLIGALTRETPASDSDDGEALLQLVVDDDLFPGLGAWEHLIVTAGDQGVISEALLLQATAPPCSGSLVLVTLPGGDIDPVTTLSTSFCTAAITFEQAKRFLEPVNWPGCNDFWCEMTPLGPSARNFPTFKEVVSLDCGNQYAWRAETRLEFAMYEVPGRAVVSYNLCDGLPQPGDIILVDSGSLMVVDNGNEICVSTTKRILFNHPFSGEALSALSCALGYGAVAEDLVFTCALEPGNPNENPGTEFPGVDPPKAPMSNEKDGDVVVSDPSSPTDKEADAMKGAIDEAVDAAKDCLDDCVEAYQKSYDKVKAGTYKADDIVQDMAAMWTRLIRDGATIVDLGMRASRASARASRPEKE